MDLSTGSREFADIDERDEVEDAKYRALSWSRKIWWYIKNW